MIKLIQMGNKPKRKRIERPLIAMIVDPLEYKTNGASLNAQHKKHLLLI